MGSSVEEENNVNSTAKYREAGCRMQQQCVPVVTVNNGRVAPEYKANLPTALTLLSSQTL